MLIRYSLLWLLVSSLVVSAKSDKPNIIFILADDMGYGDMSNAGGKVPTVNCDRLVNEGMKFTDAHTSSSVCTPTRYGILTGRYNWRSKKKSGVLNGFSDPLIPVERQTVAGYLKTQGYHTGMVGKWHLGIGWQKLPNGEVVTPSADLRTEKWKKKKSKRSPYSGRWNVDYTKPVVGPVANGFDYFFGIAASLDMAPYVYIENDKAVAPANVINAFGIPHRPGPASKDFDAMNCLTDFASKSRSYIKERARDKEKPFFLYLPLTSPHTPILPSPRWQGKSSLGSYGDFLLETDWVIGEVLAELDAQGIAENTLIVFTADNGCSPEANIPELTEKGHKPNADWRGHKADIFEGGHRVPFLVRWPAQVKSGSKTNGTVCTTDFFRTVVDVLANKAGVLDNVAEDSYSFLPLLQETGDTARKTTIHHTINGSFAIREGKWKLNLCPGSGGWSSPRPSDKKALEGLPVIQLYDLEADPAEENNLQAEHPEMIQRLVSQLASEIKNGRSTEGKKQMNDGAIPFKKDLLEMFPILTN